MNICIFCIIITMQILKSFSFFFIRNNIIRSKIFVTSENVHKFGSYYPTQFLNNKKIISISPGGFKGFYMLGICKYIKETYDLEDFIFSGASAGAWNSLVLCYKGNVDNVINNLLDESLQKTKTIHELENLVKDKILTCYNNDDFDLRRLFIGVTTISKYSSNTIIYSGFDGLEDAVNCCIASSHIPFVTGGMINKYKNIYSFDGGFSKYPYLNISKPVIHITPSIWKESKKTHQSAPSITEYTTLFSKDEYKFRELIELGYSSAIKNKDCLDALFIKKK